MAHYASNKYHLHGREVYYDGYPMGTYVAPDTGSVHFSFFDAYRFFNEAPYFPKGTIIQVMEMLLVNSTIQLDHERRPFPFDDPVLFKYPEPEHSKTVKPLIENAQRFANDVLQALRGNVLENLSSPRCYYQAR